MNKTTTFILSLVVGVIIGAVGYNLIYTATHTGSTISKHANGIDTYSNGTYGISFNFPDTYVVREKDSVVANNKRHTITLLSKADATPSASTTPIEDITTINIDVFQNSANTALAEWVKNTPESNFKLGDGVAAPASLAGQPAVTYSWNGSKTKGNSIVFAHKDNIVMASMNFLTYQDDIWKDFAGVIQSLTLK